MPVLASGMHGQHCAHPCMQPRPAAAAWLVSGDWAQQLEAMLAVRQPTEEDLAEVRLQRFNLWWAQFVHPWQLLGRLLLGAAGPV